MLGALQRAAAAAAGAAQRCHALRGLASARGAPGGGLFGISDLQQPGDFLMMMQGTFSRRVPLLPGPRAALLGRRAAISAAATPEPPTPLALHAGRGSWCATSRASSRGRRWCS
jgi:hypothetical protein